MNKLNQKSVLWFLAAFIVAIVLGTINTAFEFRHQSLKQDQSFQDNYSFFTSKYERDINIAIIAFNDFILAPDNQEKQAKYLEKIDIFWSRINAIDKGSQGKKFIEIKDSVKIIERDRKILAKIDRWNEKLKTSGPPDTALTGQIRAALDSLASDGRVLIRNAQEFQQQQGINREQQLYGLYLRTLMMGLGALLAGGITIFIFYSQNKSLQRLGSDIETALEDRSQQLTRTRAIVDALPDILFILDEDGYFIEEITNNPDSLVAEREQYKNSTLYDILPAEAADIAFDGIQRALQTNQLCFAEINLFGPRQTGVFELRIAPFPLRHKGKQQVLIIRRDVTEQKNLETQLRRSQQMEAVGQLTGGMAHDFNNLLTIVLGNAERLEKKMPKTNPHTKNIASIIDAGKRAASLTHRLLAFSKQQPLIPQPTNIAELIKGLEDLLKRTLGENIRMTLKTVPGLWPAKIDSSQFENALINLAANARDAMPGGGVLKIETANLTVSDNLPSPQGYVPPGDYVLVSVCDSGNGMPEDVLEKVFEPFFTTKDVGKGSGLGLSMVYGFVNQSQGHILIESDIGKGTTIRIFLPRSDEQAPGEHNDKNELPLLKGGTERILVVEDEDRVRDIIVTILRDHGYKVTEAANGKEAIAVLNKSQKIDLLFSDIVLPGHMNGFQIAEQARIIQPDIKVLFTSGYAETDVIDQSLDDIGENLVRKPFRQSIVLKKIRRILDQD